MSAALRGGTICANQQPCLWPAQMSVNKTIWLAPRWPRFQQAIFVALNQSIFWGSCWGEIVPTIQHTRYFAATWSEDNVHILCPDSTLAGSCSETSQTHESFGQAVEILSPSSFSKTCFGNFFVNVEFRRKREARFWVLGIRRWEPTVVFRVREAAVAASA